VPLTTFGSGRPIACRMVGATSMTWPNWLRISFFALIPFGQLHHHAVARAAEVGRHLLHPAERSIERDRPAGRHVRVGLGAAPLVGEFEHVLDLLGTPLK
jgi:hypothetical protein